MFSTLLRRLAVSWPRVGRPRLVRPQAVVVGTVALVVAAVAFVLRFGSNCPVGDEWYLVKDVLDHGFSWQWAVAHHNEHRYVLAKTLWYASLAATRFDFRAGTFVTLGLVTASVGLVLAAIRSCSLPLVGEGSGGGCECPTAKVVLPGKLSSPHPAFGHPLPNGERAWHTATAFQDRLRRAVSSRHALSPRGRGWP